MQPGLVSIMMPAYNAEQHIGQAIESVLAQSYPHWELIVVNDGSTDRTGEVATQFSDPRIRIFHQPNGGESSARNAALRQMQGEFVAFLDADDLYLPHHLEVTVGYLQAHPGRDGVYTDGHYCDQDEHRLKPLSSRRRGPFEGRVFEEAVRASDIFGPPACVVLRRHLITQYNLRFDENITIGPDWVFFIEYTDVAQFGYLAQDTCLYRVHQTNITNRTGLQKRALELAKCRSRAIKMTSFRTCSPQTRAAVFYDLLVKSLRGFPERQAAVVQWPEFTDLPANQQARLLRLMASKAMSSGREDARYINEWLHRSRKLNPTDWRGTLISAVYNLSPQLCKLLLRVRTLRQSDPLNTVPFADLEGTPSTARNAVV